MRQGGCPGASFALPSQQTWEANRRKGMWVRAGTRGAGDARGCCEKPRRGSEDVYEEASTAKGACPQAGEAGTDHLPN